MRRLALLLLATSTLSAHTQANEPQECRELTQNSARLACYDKLFGAPPEAATPVSVPVEEISEVGVRLKSERQLASNRFVILPHRQTYILPYTYSEGPNTATYLEANPELSANDVDNEEIKFQISLKVPIAQDLLIDGSSLWLGYTQVSLWQAYNDASAPFRETNYEPEIYWTVPTNLSAFGVTLEEAAVGFVHQSNGRGESLSRSWNRVFANFVFAKDQWSFAIKPWYRIPEDRADDDNPDIEAYLGYADFIGSYKWGDFTLSAKINNNFRSSDNHTSTTLSLSLPLPGRLNGYIEYVDGYGETLIDYNHRNQRIGIGLILNDWF